MKKAAIISTLVLMASCAFCAGAKRFGKMTDNDWVVTNAWQAMQHRVTPDSAWATNHFESSQFADAVNDVVVIPSTNEFVTAKAATNIAEYIVSTNGFLKRADKIDNGKYIIDANLNYIRVREPTNSFVCTSLSDGSITIGDIERIWGTASATNFEYVGIDNGTSIWQNVYLDGGICKTNSITLDVDFYEKTKSQYGYDINQNVLHGLKSNEGYSYSVLVPYGAFVFDRFDNEHGGLVDYPIFFIIMEQKGTTTKLFYYHCHDVFNNGNTKLVTELNTVKLVNSDFEAKESDYGKVRYLNNDSTTSMQICLTNRWYEYKFHTQDGSYSNVFYTSDNTLCITNTGTPPPIEIGHDTLTFKLSAFPISTQETLIDNPFYGFVEVITHYGGDFMERNLWIPKYPYDAISDFDTYNHPEKYEVLSNLVCTVTPVGDGTLKWIDIDKSRFDYLNDVMVKRDFEIVNSIKDYSNSIVNNATSVLARVAHTGSYNDLSDKPSSDHSTNTITKLHTTLGNDRINFVVDKTASQSRLDLVNDTVLHLENANQIWVGGSADTNDEKKIVGAQTYMSIVDGVARSAADAGVASAMLTYSNRVDGVLNTYTNAINPRVDSAESKANAAIDACAVYSNQYEAVTNDNTMTRAVVYTWENFLDGSNVVFSITNYVSGTYSLDTAKLKIMELRDGTNYVEVYNSHDEIALHMDYFKTNEFQRSMVAFSNSVNTAIAGKADKAWGKYTSTGEDVASVYASNTVWITEPTSVFAGGTEYKRFAVGEGSVCVLTTHGAPIYTHGEEGIFKFEDMGGTNYFGFAKTDSYEIGADASGISVQNQMVTITYDVVMSGVPCIWYKEAIESSDAWERLNNPDGTAIPGVSHVVSWVQNPPEGKKICNINVTGEPKGFFRATIEVAGESKFITNMPADLGGGILCTDGQHKVKIDWNNGNPRFVEAQ